MAPHSYTLPQLPTVHKCTNSSNSSSKVEFEVSTSEQKSGPFSGLKSTVDKSRWKLAACLASWRRTRDAVLRRPRFCNQPLNCKAIPWLNGRFSIVEVLLLGVILSITFGYVAYAIGTGMPQPPRRASDLCIMLTLMLATHNSIFNFIFGLPFERRLFWHKLFAVTANILGWTHGLLALRLWPTPTGHRLVMMVSGFVLATICLTFLLISCPSMIRRRCWNLFHMVHWVLTLGLIGAAVVHESYMTIAGVGILLLDMAIRKFYMALLAHPHDAEIKALPAEITRLTLAKPKHFRYEPGQYVFVMIPKVSLYEWHPFTLSSSPHTNQLTLHIKTLGDWTASVRELALNTNTDLEAQSESGSGRISAYIEGPYGQPEIDLLGKRYKFFLAISAGIGVTPMQSLTNWLVHEAIGGKRKLLKLHFIWSTPESSLINSLFEADRQSAGPINCWQDEQFEGYTGFKDNYVSNVDVLDTVTEKVENKQRIEQQSQMDVMLTRSLHLTRAKCYEDLCKTTVSLGMMSAVPGLSPTQDPTSGLQLPPALLRHVKFGRPKFERQFEKMRCEALAAGKRRVAVLVCGPATLVEQIRSICADFNAKNSKENGVVHFDLHSERFDF